MASPNPTLLIIPGAWHTPIFFDPLLAAFSKYSYPTVSKALPSVASSNPKFHTAQTDTEFIRNSLLLPLLEEGKEVIVVMHSYGGLPGSAAAFGLSVEERKKADLQGGVLGLVYICAFIAPSGEAASDLDFPGLEGRTFDEEGNVHISPAGSTYNFYNDLPHETGLSWGAKLSPIALQVLTTSVAETAHESPAFRGRMAYVQCTKDNAIPLEMQQRFVESAGIEHVVTLETDHSPFLSMPERLAEVIVEMIEKFG